MAGKIRYIRDRVNGSNASGGNYWVEIEVYDEDGNNIALGTSVSVSPAYGGSGTNLARLTDGNLDTAQYGSISGGSGGNGEIQIDLGGLYLVAYIKVWHYYGDKRNFNSKRTQVSDNGSTWIDMALPGTGSYQEHSGGTVIRIPSVYFDLIPVHSHKDAESSDVTDAIKALRQSMSQRFGSIPDLGAQYNIGNDIKEGTTLGTINTKLKAVDALYGWDVDPPNKFEYDDIQGMLSETDRISSLTECSSDCSSLCKNNCSNSCFGICKDLCIVGCGDGCAAACSTPCTTNCSTACSGCGVSCAIGCGAACQSSCGGSCEWGCVGNCDTQCGVCDVHCTANCSEGCRSFCDAGCGVVCDGGCGSTCAHSCYTGCKDYCELSCGAQCYAACANGCGTACASGCGAWCDGGCSSSCAGNCYAACVAYCGTICQTNCGGLCFTSCLNWCTTTCGDECSNYCYGSAV